MRASTEGPSSLKMLLMSSAISEAIGALEIPELVEIGLHREGLIDQIVAPVAIGVGDQGRR